MAGTPIATRVQAHEETHPLFAGFGNKAGRGIGGHHSASSATDEWLTPPEVIEALGGAQSFDIDPCAPRVRPWPTAQLHYTDADNGLILPWRGRAWCNPPYSPRLLAGFMGRMADHGCGTALIFARTETDAFFRFVWQAATAVLFLRGRLNFHFVDGARAKANSGAPSALVAYGAADAAILEAANLDGQFVVLKHNSDSFPASRDPLGQGKLSTPNCPRVPRCPQGGTCR